MSDRNTTAIEKFTNEVGIKFQLYNSLFSSLPFHRIEKTGIYLAVLQSQCEEGYEKNKSPEEIIVEFFEKNTHIVDEDARLDLLFRFVQYAERQVVLFDALEDAAYEDLHDMNGPGTLKSLETELIKSNLEPVLKEKLRDFAIRLVLTAHPTQFYPAEVLWIITDLSEALAVDDAGRINKYLMQLGKTPFFKHEKPTPYDEAVSLIWYLEHVFYKASGNIIDFLGGRYPDAIHDGNPIIKMGFWPGGDRDGNPFVTIDISTRVAGALRAAILRCYYNDVRELRRRLTFRGVTQPLMELERLLYRSVFLSGVDTAISKIQLLETLSQIKQSIIKDHSALFVEMLDALINRIKVFGLYFASLDVRQESSVHGRILAEVSKQTGALPYNYTTLCDAEKIKVLGSIQRTVEPELIVEPVENDTITTIRDIQKIQALNGEEGCHRYIISFCISALNIMEVYGLFLLTGWKKEKLSVDIVPLFETIGDLQNAADIMETLYDDAAYRAHLARRKNTQTIMLGFSDGTKDGGYLMANWSIYLAKDKLTAISRKYDIDVIFFDGRGGPPARGGGKTHKFYASMGQNIANREIQLTIQGQTVSSNFGIVSSAQFNMEQLLHAILSSSLQSSTLSTFEKKEERLVGELAQWSMDSYLEIKNDPLFFEYLSHASPVRFYADTNIGSRPAKRGNAKITLKDLRAIPFVGSLSMMKQNITGYYGLGTALKKLEDDGRLAEAIELYQERLFFRTLIDNSEMAMKKCFFPLTAFWGNHPQFGPLWHKIYNEYLLTKEMVLKLSGNKELMGSYPVEQMSVQMRERIIMPVTTIQQFAMARLRQLANQKSDTPLKSKYEKLVVRCAFGIINAGRNSA